MRDTQVCIYLKDVIKLNYDERVQDDEIIDQIVTDYKYNLIEYEEFEKKLNARYKKLEQYIKENK